MPSMKVVVFTLTEKEGNYNVLDINLLFLSEQNIHFTYTMVLQRQKRNIHIHYITKQIDMMQNFVT